MTSQLAGVEVDSSWKQDDVVLSKNGNPMFRSEESAWGAVVSFERRGPTIDDNLVASTSSREKEPQWIVDVLVNCSPRATSGESTRRLAA